VLHEEFVMVVFWSEEPEDEVCSLMRTLSNDPLEFAPIEASISSLDCDEP